MAADGIGELWFESPKAMEQAMKTPQMGAAVEDGKRFLDMQKTDALPKVDADGIGGRAIRGCRSWSGTAAARLPAARRASRNRARAAAIRAQRGRGADRGVRRPALGLPGERLDLESRAEINDVRWSSGGWFDQRGHRWWRLA